MSFLRKRDWTPLILAAAAAAMWALLHAFLGGSFFGPSLYNTYTRQALAWRQGMLHLPADVPYLELAVYQGDYYVSFPPVPSLILWPLTFLFGMETPDNLLVKLYALGGCLMIYFALRRAGYSRLSGGLLAFLFCFASSLLPMTLNGAVWYHAQLLGFFLTVAAICFIARDLPTPALLCYALAVGCRPFNALYGVPLFAVWFLLHARAGVPLRRALSPLFSGVTLGLLVAFELGMYNYVRFGSPLEFGHNYLPEFSTQGGVQFSVAHVARNVKTFLWGAPVDVGEDGAITVKAFGYSLFLACPTLTLMFLWAAGDLFRRRMSPEKAAVTLTCVLHGFLLLMHRTFGGYQLGARYAVDLVPYALLYLLLSPKKTRLHPVEAIFLLAVFAFTLWGLFQVHI